MRAVYAHFPINMHVNDDGSVVEIRNFLGEKYQRTVKMRRNVTAAPTGVKDEIKVEGNDLEMVSQSGTYSVFVRVLCACVCACVHVLYAYVRV